MGGSPQTWFSGSQLGRHRGRGAQGRNCGEEATQDILVASSASSRRKRDWNATNHDGPFATFWVPEVGKEGMRSILQMMKGQEKLSNSAAGTVYFY